MQHALLISPNCCPDAANALILQFCRYTYLNKQGRTVVVLRANNVIDALNQPFVVRLRLSWQAPCAFAAAGSVSRPYRCASTTCPRLGTPAVSAMLPPRTRHGSSSSRTGVGPCREG